jgi:hypothetical protein
MRLVPKADSFIPFTKHGRVPNPPPHLTIFKFYLSFSHHGLTALATFASPSVRHIEIFQLIHQVDCSEVDSVFLSSMQGILSKLCPLKLVLHELGYRTTRFLLEALTLDQLNFMEIDSEGDAFMSPLGEHVDLKPDMPSIKLPNLTNLTIKNFCLPYCVHFLRHIRADKLEYLTIKIPPLPADEWYAEEILMVGPLPDDDEGGLPLEVCIRYFCESLGPNFWGSVSFPELASCEIELHTPHPANYEIQLIEQDILNMLKHRTEAGAVPMVPVSSPHLEMYEHKYKGTGLRCRFELVSSADLAFVSVHDEDGSQGN